jgi:hypothetical protein
VSFLLIASPHFWQKTKVHKAILFSNYLCRVRLLKSTGSSILKLRLFWVIIFDIERMLFSIHNWGEFPAIGFEERNFSFHMDAKKYPDQTFSQKALKKEEKRCHSYMSLIYKEYKEL